jgi:excisionase family DNA binding protein
MKEMGPDEMTGGEAARLLGVTRQQVSHLARTGKLLGYQFAGRWVFRLADVLAYQRSDKPRGGRPSGPMYGRKQGTE